jgi:hypothetical protein
MTVLLHQRQDQVARRDTTAYVAPLTITREKLLSSAGVSLSQSPERRRAGPVFVRGRMMAGWRFL